MTGKLTVVVIGAGAMGSITVRDLVETAPEHFRIVVADYDLAAARALAKGNPRVKAVVVDVTKVRETAKLLAEHKAFAVICAVQHQFNVRIMEAALRANAHYVDLGGLFHQTRKQLGLHRKYKKAGLLALLGFGAAPGVVNVLARAVADEMEAVREIHVLVGNVDRTPGRSKTTMGTSYSIQTILEEASTPAALFPGGKFTFVPPMSGAVDVNFPAPVGLRRPAYTIHSEVATLPLSYKKKGVREVSFRIAFSEDLDEKLRFLYAIGMLGEKALERPKVAPREVLLALLRKLPKPPPSAAIPDEYEILRVVVQGKKNGREIEETIDCHVPGIPAWGLGVDADTGCPPSIFVQMLARGEIDARGALPAEVAIPVQAFFAELQKRGMRIERRVTRTGRVAA